MRSNTFARWAGHYAQCEAVLDDAIWGLQRPRGGEGEVKIREFCGDSGNRRGLREFVVESTEIVSVHQEVSEPTNGREEKG